MTGDTKQCGRLEAGQGIFAAAPLKSCDGRSQLGIWNGNLEWRVDNVVRWSANNNSPTSSNGIGFVMQNDGNAVLYAASSPAWASGTYFYQNQGLYLGFETNGDLAIYSRDGRTKYWSWAGRSPSQKLTTQPSAPVLGANFMCSRNLLYESTQASVL